MRGTVELNANGNGSRRIAAIIPAAGLSKRHPPQKLLVEIEGKPAIVHTVERCLRVSMVPFVVLGHEAERVSHAMRGLDELLRIVHNPGYRDGMATSIVTGLKAAGEGWDYYAIWPGDKPFIHPETVLRLLHDLPDVSRSRRSARIIAPAYQSRRGHPVFFHASLYSELTTLEGDTGARSVVNAHSDEMKLVEVKDEGVLVDMDRWLEEVDG
jgi:molybdenum cofactor cytidylyltransferase